MKLALIRGSISLCFALSMLLTTSKHGDLLSENTTYKRSTHDALTYAFPNELLASHTHRSLYGICSYMWSAEVRLGS